MPSKSTVLSARCRSRPGRLAASVRAASLAGLAFVLACKDPTAGPGKLSGSVPVQGGSRAAIEAQLLKARPTPKVAPNGAEGVSLGGGKVRYLGFDVSPFPVPRGATAMVTHYWEVKEAPGEDWRLFVHVQAGADFINADHVPMNGLDPLGSWKPGDLVPDRHPIPIPATTAAEKVEVLLGLWNAGGRMPIDDKRFDDGTGRLKAGPIPITGVPALPPSYSAPHTSGPITIDGKLDEPDWKKAPAVLLKNTMNGSDPRYKTEARVLWDAENLYVGFVSDDDDVWAREGRKKDDAIYEDEVVEVFVDADGDGKTYNELEVSPANVQFDAMFVSYRSDLKAALAWDSGMRSAVTIQGTLNKDSDQDSGWTAELAIPLAKLAAVPRPPKQGDKWRFNLYRIDNHNRAHEWDGAALSPPLRGDFHALDRFATLQFD
jgi:hypothetical protein